MASWVPPVSPYGLIQETVWPDGWLLLVVCSFLNRTSRKQVEKVLPEFVKRWPTPQAFLGADLQEVKGVCRPLGFASRRTDLLVKMTRAFLTSSWQNVRDLPGVGEYAARSWEIFMEGKLGDEPPKDHALVKYWEYCRLHGYGKDNTKSG